MPTREEEKREQNREDTTRAFRKAIAKERVSALEYPSWVTTVPMLPAFVLTGLVNYVFYTDLWTTLIVFGILYVLIGGACLALYEHVNS